MKKTMSETDFMEEVRKWEDRKDQFSPEGWQSLYRFIDQMDEETGSETELDIVAFCCEYAEYDSAWEAMEQYQPEDMPCEGEEGDDLPTIAEKNEQAAREWLEDRTTIIPVEGTGRVIIAQF